MPIRILIADDHEVVRCGLRSLVENSDVEVAGEASSGEEAIQQVTTVRPNVLLLDIRLPDGDGLKTLGRIKLDHPDLPVLMFSAYDNPTYVARAVALGASGYLLKD